MKRNVEYIMLEAIKNALGMGENKKREDIQTPKYPIPNADEEAVEFFNTFIDGLATALIEELGKKAEERELDTITFELVVEILKNWGYIE